VVFPASCRISRVPQYSGSQPEECRFRIRGYHPLRPAFPVLFCYHTLPTVGPSTPTQPKPCWFGLLRFRSPLLTESFLFLRVLGCFSSPSSPLDGYVFTTGYAGIPQRGFPHSDIDGSQLLRNSPSLIAAQHVLLRRLTPRHPPCALSSLTKNHCSRYELESLDALILFSF
jgi:hypothetical protein